MLVIISLDMAQAGAEMSALASVVLPSAVGCDQPTLASGDG